MQNDECRMGNGLLPAAVVFDMDGVLVDTEPVHAELYVGMFRELGLATTVEDYRRSITIGGMSVLDFYCSLGGDPETWDSLSGAKAELYQAALAKNGRPMPGVLDLLNALLRAGIPTAVATSAGRRSLTITLDCLGLRPYFRQLVAWQDVTAEKPDPAAFLLAAKKLGVKPEDCAVIEDSPRGVLAASRAGMKCIAIPTLSTADGDFSPATLMVASLTEVSIETLRGLFAPTLP